MNRNDLAYPLGLFVLIAGLASCSKEENAKDFYKTPPPTVVTRKGHQKLTEWDRAGDKTLDLQDSFDVSAGRPTKAIVTAFCAREKINSVKTFTVDGRRPVKVFQIVPEDILFDDLSKTAVSCEWEISLYNETGSRHVLRVGSAPIADGGDAQVQLDNANPQEKIASHKHNAVKIRYRNSETAAAQILCRDVTFEALPFQSVMDFDQFNLRRPKLRDDKSPLELMARPLQSCRVAILEGGALRQLSPRIEIQIPRKPITAKAHPVLNTQDRGFHLPTFLSVTSVHYADAVIENFTEVKRTIKIPKALNVKLDAVTKYSPPGSPSQKITNRFVMNLPWIRLNLGASTAAAKDNGDSWIVRMEPQSRFVLHAIFHRELDGCFKTFDYFQGFKIEPDPLAIDELSDLNEAIERINVQLPVAYPGVTEQQLQSLSVNPKPCI